MPSATRNRKRILLFDKDRNWVSIASETLTQAGCDVFSVNCLAGAIHMLRSDAFDLIVTDINSDEGAPDFVINQLCDVGDGADIVVCTPTSSLAQAVQAGKLGVVAYLDRTNPRATLGALREHIQRASGERSSSSAQPKISTAPIAGATGAKSFCGILSRDPRMHAIFELIQTISTSSVNVLIEGETGTGKELVAHAIHACSNRSAQPFVILDCSTLTHELLESELFGHEKGAFTGATLQRIGRFERADLGTLFLDEATNINLSIQAKLLRVLESRTFERVGGQKTIAVDVRVVVASNRRLEECVAAGSFRADLFHRLHVVHILVPPLRQRPDDIPILARQFIQRFAREHGKPVHGITDAAMRCMTAYRWPGNVRELENAILQAVVLSRSNMLDVTDLPPRIWNSMSASVQPASNLANRLQESEREILVATLKEVNGNIKRAAGQLKISRTTLYTKLKHYAIDAHPNRPARITADSKSPLRAQLTPSATPTEVPVFDSSDALPAAMCLPLGT